MILLFDAQQGSIQCGSFEDGRCLKPPVKIPREAFRRKILNLAGSHPVETLGYRLCWGGHLFPKPMTLLRTSHAGKIAALEGEFPQKNGLIVGAIRRGMQSFPRARHVLMCEDAFYSELPEYARTYALPHKFSKYKIRKYGREGLSHQWAYAKAGKRSGKKAERCVSVFLGDETNIVAMHKGKAVEVSDGFMNACGLMSKTGCGEIDPYVIFRLISGRLSMKTVEKMFTEQSGFCSLAGRPCSLDNLLAREDRRATMAKEIYVYRLLKWIGAYVATLGGVDRILFIGEKKKKWAALAREVVAHLSFLGAEKKHKIVLSEVCDLTKQASRVDGYFFENNRWQVMSELLYDFLEEGTDD